MKLDKETISKFSPEEKKDLYDFLIAEGIDPVYVEWLVYGKDFRDVVESDNANPSVDTQ